MNIYRNSPNKHVRRAMRGMTRTCTNGNWNCGACTGTGIAGARAEPFRGFSPAGKTRRAEMYGREYADTDAADAAMLEAGMLQPFGRNLCEYECSRSGKRHGYVRIVGNPITPLGWKNGQWSAAFRMAERGMHPSTIQDIFRRQWHPYADYDHLAHGALFGAASRRAIALITERYGKCDMFDHRGLYERLRHYVYTLMCVRGEYQC